MPQNLSIGGDEKRFHTVGNIFEFWFHRVVGIDGPNNVLRLPKKVYPPGVFFQVGSQRTQALQSYCICALWCLHEPSANLGRWEWQRSGSDQ